MKNYQTFVVDHDNAILSETLGIGRKRNDELNDLVHKLMAGPIHKLSVIMEEATGMCDNINEASYVCYLVGLRVGESKFVEKLLKGGVAGIGIIKKNCDDCGACND